MSSAVKTVFGGTDDSAQNAQQDANAATQRFIAEQAAAARKDILKLYPAADTNRNLGFQGALDVFSQTIPQEQRALQAGNLQAQQHLLAGLPQMQNAILGTAPINFTGFRPQTVPLNLGYASQRLPNFIGTGDLLPPEEEENASNLLGGA